MTKKLKDGANKKKHSELLDKKKQKIAKEKTARALKLKAMYAKLNEEKK